MKNNNIKKIAALIALVLCAAAMMLVFTGCGGKVEVTDIYITKANMPRVEYVEGQDLDFSDGRLTVMTSEGEKSVSLLDPQVTISGYDKTKLGEQSVSIQYGGLTTSITVKVKARMVASNFETSYFVGGNFNKKIGKLQVTTDDMKTVSVNMSDEKVALVSFDSSKAGMVPVTVSYTDGGNTYTCQFNVTVYEEANVEFVAPYKTQYNSYDDHLDTSGAYFTVTSSDGKLTKQVPLTAEMVTDFDLSVATIANRQNAKKQNVKVAYLGREFTFEIQITFRGISVVNYHAQNSLSKINWEDAKTNGLPEDISADAIDALREFYTLSNEYMAMLSEDVKSLVVRAGSIAVANAFFTELGKYSQTIGMDSSGNLFFVGGTYEQTKQDVEKLSDAEELVNVYAALIRKLKEEYGDVMLDDQVNIGSLLIIYSEDIERNMLDIFQHLLSVHELISVVPQKWDAESLKAHGDKLMQAAMEIYNAGYYRAGYGNYYWNVMVPWRANKDAFDILYTYFLYDYENNASFMTTYMWGNIPLPGPIEDWYRCVNYAAGYSNNFVTNGNGSAYLADVTGYMFYYHLAQELSEEIKNSGNQLWVDVYNAFTCDYMAYYYMYAYKGGYLHLVKGMEDSEAFAKLWTAYYEVVKLVNSNKLTVEGNKAELTAMFNAFQELSPAELLGFLSSLNYNYSSAGGTIPVLSYDEETAFNLFTAILRDFYTQYLTETNKPLFATMLQAMENFALMGQKTNAAEQFNKQMQQLSASYNTLSEADRTNFDTYMGVAYQKYLRLYQMATGTVTITLTEAEEAMFNQLQQVLEQYFTGYMAIMNALQAQQGVGVDWYNVVFCLHAQANKLYNQILESGSQMAKDALYLLGYELAGGESSLAQGFYVVEELTMNMMEGNYIVMTDANGFQQQIACWDVYTKHGMAPFMADVAQLLYKAYFTEDPAMEQAVLVSMMARIREMTAMERSGLMALGVEEAFYKALYNSLNAQMTQEAADSNFVQHLLTAERMHLNCLLSEGSESNAEAKDAFLAQMELVVAAYAALSEADQAFVNATYNYYLAIYQQMKAA